MRKDKLRSLALGFLTSAILLGCYAIFFQGHVPVQGVKVESILGTSKKADKEIEKYKSEVDKLSKENEEISSKLEEKAKSESSKAKKDKEKDKEISSLKKANSSLSRNVSSLKKANESISELDDETTDESSVASSSSDTSSDESYSSSQSETTTYEPAVSGYFTISPGDGSTDIAYNLEAQGFIDSAYEFLELVDYWNLSTILQTGTHYLTSDMSIHEIAEILTGYVYYYIP